jgi:hypothetical protein
MDVSDNGAHPVSEWGELHFFINGDRNCKPGVV